MYPTKKRFNIDEIKHKIKHMRKTTGIKNPSIGKIVTRFVVKMHCINIGIYFFIIIGKFKYIINTIYNQNIR